MPIQAILPDHSTTWSILAGVLLACIGGFANWWHRAKPARERAEEGWNAILGTSEVKDLGGGIIRKGQTGLLDRVTHLEIQGSETAQALLLLADQQDQIRAIRTDVKLLKAGQEGHDQAIAAILADKWENGAKDALKAVIKRNQDVIDVEEEN